MGSRLSINEVKNMVVSEISRTVDGLRRVEAGAPYFDMIEKVSPTPAAFVTSDQLGANFEYIGADGVPDDTDVKIPRDLEYRFGCIIVVSGKDGQAAEMAADDLAHEVCEAISSNPRLAPVTDDGRGAGRVELAEPKSIHGREIGNSKLARYVTITVRVVDP